MQVVLVTGGNGFIGSNLVRQLLAETGDVRVFDNFSTGTYKALEGLDVDAVEGDLRDAGAVAQAVKGCSAVIHLAASTSVLESVNDPWPTFEVNVLGTLNVLEAAAREGVRRFIFASSNAALGEQNPPLNEGMVASPVSPYGASKLAGEAYCHAYSRSKGLDTVILRFANVYGPHSGHKTSVVAKLMGQVLNGQPVTIYGDGKQTRDFIHVADVVDAVVRSLNMSVSGELFQIGTGIETSVIELVEILARVSGREPSIRWLPQPEGEVRRNYSSIAHARSGLGFEPAWDLAAGMADTFNWFTSRTHGERPSGRRGPN